MTVTIIDLDAEFAAIAAVIIAGRESMYYVRGAMDPRFTEPQARDGYARRLARFAPTYAAAFLRGWVEHREDSRHAEAMRRGEEAWARFRAARDGGA